MHPTKQEKTAKSKTTTEPSKDLRPAKDPKGGGQKKEGPGINTLPPPPPVFG